jgi:hypothetical protein
MEKNESSPIGTQCRISARSVATTIGRRTALATKKSNRDFRRRYASVCGVGARGRSRLHREPLQPGISRCSADLR